MKLEFNNPFKRCYGERKSKLLLKDSKLYVYLKNLKNILTLRGFSHTDRMDLHSEVLNNNNESIHDFLKRVKALNGKTIDVYDKNNYGIVGGAVVLFLGNVEGYSHPAKITIAYFDNGKTHDAFKCLMEYIYSLK